MRVVREIDYRLAIARTLLGVSLFLVYCWTSLQPKNSRQNLDTFSAFVPAWSLGHRGTLDVPEFLGSSPWIQEHGGQVLSDRMPGIIFWAAPFYTLLGTDGGPSFRVAGIASSVAATLAVLVMYRVFRLHLSERDSLVGCGLLALGTATWTVSATALWAHGIDQLVIAVSLLSLARGRHLTTGFALAYGVLTRPHLALVALVFGLGEGIRKRSVTPIVKVGAASSLGLLALLAYNIVVFDQATLLVGVYSDRTATASNTVSSGATYFWDAYLMGVVGTLVSPLRGLLVLSPFLLMLIPGLRRAWTVAPFWTRGGAVAGALYMAVQLLGNGFAGGTFFFSYRLPIEWLTLTAPLLAVAWREWTSQVRWRRVTFVALSAVSVFQHAVGPFLATDDLSFDTRPWSRSQVLEGLASATPSEWASLGAFAFGVAAIILITTLLARPSHPGQRPRHPDMSSRS